MHRHSIQELDRGEGAALHAHLFEEAIDWSEPLRK
jgi:protein phosphatase 1 regulatory subunit 10